MRLPVRDEGASNRALDGHRHPTSLRRAVVDLVLSGLIAISIGSHNADFKSKTHAVLPALPLRDGLAGDMGLDLGSRELSATNLLSSRLALLPTIRCRSGCNDVEAWRQQWNSSFTVKRV